MQWRRFLRFRKGGRVDSVEEHVTHCDIENEGEKHKPKHKVVNNGLWIPSRYGEHIEISQWRVIEGNFRFFCDGRIMVGKDFYFWWLIVIYVLAIVSVFITFEVVPNFSGIGLIVLTGSTITFACLSLINFVKVIIYDPGYVPLPDPEERLDNIIHYHTLIKTRSVWEKTMVVNGKAVETVFCVFCCQFRPPRAAHCLKCGICIERLDHHCEIFSKCIGRRNYGYFCLFLIYAHFFFIIVLSVSLNNFISSWANNGFTHAAGSSPTVFLLLCSLIIPPLGLIELLILVYIHLYLIAVDKTTYEKTQGIRPSREKGWKFISCALKNFKELVINRPPPMKIKPRSIVRLRAVPKRLNRRDWRDEFPLVNSTPTTKRKSRSVLSACYRKKEDLNQFGIERKPRSSSVPTPRRNYIQRLFDSRCVCSNAFERSVDVKTAPTIPTLPPQSEVSHRSRFAHRNPVNAMYDILTWHSDSSSETTNHEANELDASSLVNERHEVHQEDQVNDVIIG